MSLSDTAEYWWDVKSNRKPACGNGFYHIKDVDCGHNHYNETNDIKIIDCHACKKLLNPEMVFLLNERNEQDIKKKEQSANDKKNHLEKIGRLCVCGEKLIEKTNRATKEKFLGCSSYPKCKKTKKLMQ